MVRRGTGLIAAALGLIGSGGLGIGTPVAAQRRETPLRVPVPPGRTGPAAERAPADRPGAEAPARTPAKPLVGNRLPDRAADVEFSVEARAAAIGDLLARISASLGSDLDVADALGDQRVSVYAAKTTQKGLQTAVAALFRTRWTVEGEGKERRWFLQDNADLRAAGNQLAAERRRGFLARLLQTQLQLQRGDAEQLAAVVRASVARRMPEFPDSALADITGDYLRETLLLNPIRYGAVTRLLQEGSVTVPVRALSGPQQELLGRFFYSQAEPNVVLGKPVTRSGMGSIEDPSAQAQYRFAFADRWTGSVMVVRVGAGEQWADTVLPSVLFTLPDYQSLYPEARNRVIDPSQNVTLDARIDPGNQTLDQALAAISRSAKVNIVADSYLRPDIYRPREQPALISGTLGQVLDKVAERYGCFWWRVGDYYVFRSKLFHEQDAAAIPERWMQAASNDLSRSGALASERLTDLTALSADQLMTVDLYGAAKGATTVSADRFDFGDLEDARTGLLLFSQCNAPQQEMALGSGLPYRLMPPALRRQFARFAADYGYNVDPVSASFRLTQRFRREKLPAGAAHLGAVGFVFDFGTGGRFGELAIRVPANDLGTASSTPNGDLRTNP